MELVRHLLAVARIAVRQGKPCRAVPLYEEALTVQRAVLGDAHPDVAATWAAMSLATRGPRSLDASRQALHADGAWLESGAAAGLDDQQLRAAVVALTAHADQHLTLLLTGPPEVAKAAEAVGVAAWRRRVPDLLVRPWRTSSIRHPAERALSAVLAEMATRHQERYSTADADRSVWTRGFAWITHGERLRDLRTGRAETEAQLRREAAPGEAARPLASGRLTRARQALAEDERFVDILRVAGRYRALVIGPVDEYVAALDLGPAAPIEAAALRARVALEGPGRAAAFRDVLPPSAPDADADTSRPLARLVVEPLLPHLVGCRRVRMALDGPLLHVPVGVLPAGRSGGPLLARLAVDYVTTIDELTPHAPAGAAPGPDVVLAAPDFDLGRAGPANLRSFFRPLDGTAGEADGIARLRPAAVQLVGAHALKALLRSVQSPRVLHLATHGYAFAETDTEALDDAAQRLRPRGSRLGARFANLRRESDLRSGLALGANTWLEHGDPGPEAETGLLTVADVVGLDLTNTELVVLSACDTGVGEISAPDGHASLRAAFLRAGARTVVASLWKVPDEPTRDFMIRFYGLLGEGRTPAEAMRTAQLERYEVSDPALYWGAFVCYGGLDAS